MINNWSKFNKNDDNIEEKLTKIFLDVRECFLELEDMKIVDSYGFYPNSPNYVNRYRPNIDQQSVEMFIKTVKVQNTFTKMKNIVVDIKFPTNNDIINSEGIKLFEYILFINDRLTHLGYDVKLDMNANHHQYKPMKFIIYFNI